MSLHDSGDRTVYESGAMRDRAPGKGRYDALQVFALRRIALILEAADKKYGDCRNWEKGMPMSRFIDSGLRHLCQYIEGADDQDDHLGQAAWNLLSALQTEEMIKRGLLPTDLDDLPRYGQPKMFFHHRGDTGSSTKSYIHRVDLAERQKLIDAGCIEWQCANKDGSTSIFWILPGQIPENFSFVDAAKFFGPAQELFGPNIDLKYCDPSGKNPHPPGFHFAFIEHD